MSRVDPVILPSARKHGIKDESIMQVYASPRRKIEEDENKTMLIGYDILGRLLEVCVVESETGNYIIHAMKASYRYRKLRKWDYG